MGNKELGRVRSEPGSREPSPSVSAASGFDPSRGKSITCANCDGHGLISSWSFGVNEPDECRDCGGSGRNWQYPGGAIARYYSGPLLGRESERTA